MRFMYIALIVLATIVVVSFKFQNLQSATVSLFSASVTLPMSMMVIGVYILGMVSGSALVALVTSWLARARGK